MTYIERIDTFIASLGVEAYRVGGSVRDELLGHRPKDADYMVRGVSLDLLGKKLDDSGNHIDGYSRSKLKLRDGRHVGWRVAARGMGCIEIVLPRKEVSTGPGRHDFDIVVDPTITLAEDAQRRDFTFNALYKRVDGELIVDPLNTGLYDLERRLIRTTHPDSFRDDPLRTLRALRFVARGFDLTLETKSEMARHAEAVTGLSAKGYASGTAYDELCKILMGDHCAVALRIAAQIGVLGALLPELAPMIGFDQGSRYHDLTTDAHTFKALETAAKVDAPLRVRLALLFHDSGKPGTAWVGDDGRKHYYAKRFKVTLEDGTPDEFETLDHEVEGECLWRSAAARLNVPKRMREDVAVLVRNHMVPIKVKNAGTRVRRMRVQFGDDMLRDLILHRTCDLSGKGVKVALNHIEHVAKLERIRQEAVAAGVPASVGDLQIGGRDLQALGVEGRRIGEVLAQVLDEVVCRPDEQTFSREWQLARAEALK